jgi:hypothetical protein
VKQNHQDILLEMIKRLVYGHDKLSSDYAKSIVMARGGVNTDNQILLAGVPWQFFLALKAGFSCSLQY